MKDEFFQLLKFGIVGVSNTLISLAVIYLCMNWLNIDYRLANGIGYFCGLINSFLWNKVWTFKSNGFWLKELLLFFLVFAGCYSLQFVLLILMVQKFGMDPQWAQPSAMIIYTLVSYAMNRMVTFGRQRSA